jgi:predicted transcriptional regulator
MKKKPAVPHTPLANAELSVMDLLWRQEPLSARQIREQLYPGQGASQNGTVQRLLQRLHDKGYVERNRDGSINLFTTALTRDEYAGGQLEVLANTLTSGSFAPLITHLVEKKKITPKEIKRIRAILDQDENVGGNQKGEQS